MIYHCSINNITNNGQKLPMILLLKELTITNCTAEYPYILNSGYTFIMSIQLT